jgi:hypothetical protein
MSGYIDGACDIGPIFKGGGAPRADTCYSGKISYLGGHQFDTSTPLATGSTSMGTRLFLNALFEADCVTVDGQPDVALDLTPIVVAAQQVPVDAELLASYTNLTKGAALDAMLVERVAAGVSVVSADSGGAVTPAAATWTVGSISGIPARPGDPSTSGSRGATLRFDAFGDHVITLELTYTVGTSMLTKTQPFTVSVLLDSDGDGVPDDRDPAPNDPNACGDPEGDGCDDCASGHYDPANDGCEGGQPPGDTGCCSADDGPVRAGALGLLALGLVMRGRRGRRRP